MSFTILEFKDGLQLVPTCWLVDTQGKCLFPKFLSLQRITKSIEEQEKPQSNWRVYNVKRIFGTAATYQQGLRKLNLATRFLEIDDEAESFEELIKLSSHRQYADELNEECPCCKRIQVPKYVPHDQNVQALQPIYSGSESSHLHSKANLFNSDLSLPTTKRENFESFDCQKHLENFKKKVFQRLDKLHGKLDAITKMNKNTENYMNEKLENIDKINEKLESFEEKLEKLEVREYSYNTFDDVDDTTIFPLSSIEALEQFEKDLEDEDYFSQMVNYFGRFGGVDNNSASNILTKMLSSELANECNWRGLNKKKAFSKLRLNLVVLEAVLIHRPNATKDEVYNTIARWLVYSKMKLERREERKRKSLPAKLEFDE